MQRRAPLARRYMRQTDDAVPRVRLRSGPGVSEQSVEASEEVEMIWGYSYYRRLRGPQYTAGVIFGLLAGLGIMDKLYRHGWADFASDWGLLILFGCPLIGSGVQAFFSEGPHTS